MPLRFIGGLSASQITNILMSHIPPEMQADAILNQAAPVQNTWYTVLDTTNVRVIEIEFEIATTGESLELEIIIDGRVFAVDSIAGAGVMEYCYFNSGGSCDLIIDRQTIAPEMNGRAFFFECRTLLVRIRKITANGGGNLRCGVAYQKW